jgi:hypothetical protein
MNCAVAFRIFPVADEHVPDAARSPWFATRVHHLSPSSLSVPGPRLASCVLLGLSVASVRVSASSPFTSASPRSSRTCRRTARGSRAYLYLELLSRRRRCRRVPRRPCRQRLRSSRRPVPRILAGRSHPRWLDDAPAFHPCPFLLTRSRPSRPVSTLSQRHPWCVLTITQSFSCAQEVPARPGHRPTLRTGSVIVACFHRPLPRHVRSSLVTALRLADMCFFRTPTLPRPLYNASSAVTSARGRYQTGRSLYRERTI